MESTSFTVVSNTQDVRGRLFITVDHNFLYNIYQKYYLLKQDYGKAMRPQFSDFNCSRFGKSTVIQHFQIYLGLYIILFADYYQYVPNENRNLTVIVNSTIFHAYCRQVEAQE